MPPLSYCWLSRQRNSSLRIPGSLGGTPALARELEGVLLTPVKLALLAAAVCLGFLAAFALGLFVGFLVFRTAG